MTRDEELIALAVQADLCNEYGTINWEYGYRAEIIAYGKLVAAKERAWWEAQIKTDIATAKKEEREACAKIVELNADACRSDGVAQMYLYSNATAIRARGEA